MVKPLTKSVILHFNFYIRSGIHLSRGKLTIYVTMNYRTGMFVSYGTKSFEKGALNVGLKDQRLALEWIQKNIEYFGGDKTKVCALCAQTYFTALTDA
ncbi:unnamed protein product [Rhizoctonia solani]|uniref:Carboxylesterase type B domain-containing protein n=1 Tax=Rhizoctonia solani TaxID=456999 RepID=A0A8H3GP50_9AGAM|nr:unnamed protein product [Rhizoctonia solani]